MGEDESDTYGSARRKKVPPRIICRETTRNGALECRKTTVAANRPITKQNMKMNGQNMKSMKITNPMRLKLFCLATFATAMTAAHLTAQVFTTLHSFTGGSYGAEPIAGLILSGN